MKADRAGLGEETEQQRAGEKEQGAGKADRDEAGYKSLGQKRTILQVVHNKT